MLPTLPFLAYGILGWAIDTGYRSALAQQYAPGTWLPFFSLIYAVGAVTAIWLDRHWTREKPLWQQFVILALAGTIVEYVGGLMAIQFLGRQLWDYSAENLNINGLVSPFHALAWGLLSLLLVYVIHPRLSAFLHRYAKA